MTWHSYLGPPNPANAGDVNNIFSNQKYISDRLTELGITVDTLSDVSANAEMEYYEIANIYRTIEKNFDYVSGNEYQSAYYIASATLAKKRGNYEPNRAEWQNWIDVLNDMYNILNGTVGKWQYLVLVDQYPIIDNYKIILRGDKK